MKSKRSKTRYLTFDYFFFHGKRYRYRSIGQISDIYQNALKIKEKLFKMWDEGWKEFSEFGVCWGYNKSEKVIYEATYEKSMGCKTFREDRVEDKKEYFVLTSKLEDIPLMIGQPGAKHREGIPDLTECIPLMAKILRGEECLIPKNQKLINKRLKMKTQFNHLWKIIGLCQSFIIRHIDSQCRDHSPLRGEPKIFVLNVKNCKYYCYSDGMKWIDSDSVITLDENPNEIIR